MVSIRSWPACADELRAIQRQLALATPSPWRPPARYTVGGCFVCFARGAAGRGRAGEAGWAAATLACGSRILAGVSVQGPAGYPYEPGLLALREGPLLEAAVRALPRAPDVLLVNATGRDHPRRAGLALHLGAVLELPTVGVTHRPLLAGGRWPTDEPGARTPLVLGDERVGCWLRGRAHARPVAVHAGWRTTPELAGAVALAAVDRARTPEPLRRARELARRARAGSGLG